MPDDRSNVTGICVMKQFSVIWLLVILAACNTLAEPPALPTPVDPEALATGFVLTENAPPAGFESVSFPNIDANLEQLAGWRYEMFFAFDGVFAGTPRQTSASAQASVTYNQVGSQRRVVGRFDVDLADEELPIEYEGVQLGPDVFLVRDGICSTNTDEAQLLAADLSGATLLGGVNSAVSAARTERINGQEVWLYEFLASDLVLPNVQLENARLLSAAGQLWIAPEHDVVIRYNLTLEVENATFFTETLPISGTISLQYDLFDIGIVPNISVPNGC